MTTAIVLLCLLSASPARAHGALDDHLAVRLEGRKAKLSASLPASSVSFADTDRDGLLTVEEVRASRPALLAAGRAGIRLESGTGDRPTRTLEDVIVPPGAAGAQVQYVIRAQWPSVPDEVLVRFSMFAPDHDQLALLISDGDTAPRGGVLTPEVPGARIRGDAPAEVPAPPLWWSGVSHVAAGLDHILFVFAVVLTAPRARAVLGPISAFTVAHSLALAASAAGLAPAIPAWAVESGIAASIAVIAGAELAGRAPRRLWILTALCGLVHGLGFAGALSESLGGLSGWAGALAEVTLGVEAAQLGVALASLGLLAAVRASLVHRLAALALVVVSLGWTVERVLGA